MFVGENEKDDFIVQQIKRYFKYKGMAVPDKDIDENPAEWLKKIFLDYGIHVPSNVESLKDVLIQGNRKLNTLPYMASTNRQYFPEKDFPDDHLEMTPDNPYWVDTYSITDFIPCEEYKDCMVTPEEYNDMRQTNSGIVMDYMDNKAKDEERRQKTIADAVSDPWS